MLIGIYSSWLVLVSLFVAMFASYTALDMAGRITASQTRFAACSWLGGGSFAMGLGIWSMHFIGMLAYKLPVPMGYDVRITSLSLLIAIASSGFALWLVSQNELSWRRLGAGAVLMGSGVAAMHYTGMAAMRMSPGIQYTPWLFALSIFIAIGASGAALWIAFHLRRHSSRVRLLRAGAAIVMGIAIAGMHYTGMAAAHFPTGSACGAAHAGADHGWLAILVTISTLGCLSVTLMISVLDLRLESRTAVLSTSLASANEELTYLALHDNLTKLPNRLLLEDRLNQAVQTAKRKNTRFSLMFVDLDGFKCVNDAYGHHIGDALLAEVALRILTNIRSSDTLARMGGDEFVLLTQAHDPADVAGIGEKLLTVIRRPYEIDGHDCMVSASIGISIFDGDDQHQNELLMNADAAMYHAKSLGGDRYCFFEPSMNANAQQQMQLLRDLRLALERREFLLLYQPKFDALTMALTGVEALLRWQHPERGMVPPDQFIPAAEKAGLIVPIGEWVLDEACRQMALWRNAVEADWTVAVNLSAVQFAHSGLTQLVAATLARHALEPRYLVLEVTESTAMRDVDSSMTILRQLTEMGVHISIDDFGTGYSSLLYLKRFPASELKIDRGFVRDLARDTEDAAIISAIVALGRTLNLNIVAEGVETSVQQEFLTRLGCTSLQGYLLGRPVGPDLITEPVPQLTSTGEESSPRGLSLCR
ncbi:diguanylate cyclase/phosphodiesterase [Edaphobacter modestus]|uniref:Diguanylate cyclase/phosphodiesterase n=1 Tax=Edaphobacter modestus TaxID=388466 RepID=A0A4Q7XZH5_9BACT|nr:diguanylate cyclase/phosphodiesterase [Edaphobacter modestus]